MFIKKGVLNDEKKWVEVEEINKWIEEAKSLRVDEIVVEGALLKSKLAWKVAVLSQCYLHRMIELAEACSLTWNTGHYIAALTMARSIIETGVIFCDLDDKVRDFLLLKDVVMLDDYVMNKTFATRLEEWLVKDDKYRAQNITTLVQKKDKKDLPGLWGVYETLSEHVHPNQLGHFQHYGELDHRDGTVRFGKNKSVNAQFHSVLCAFPFVGFSYNAHKRIVDSLDQLAEIHVTALKG